jgi:hypothetical protein
MRPLPLPSEHMAAGQAGADVEHAIGRGEDPAVAAGAGAGARRSAGRIGRPAVVPHIASQRHAAGRAALAQAGGDPAPAARRPVASTTQRAAISWCGRRAAVGRRLRVRRPQGRLEARRQQGRRPAADRRAPGCGPAAGAAAPPAVPGTSTWPPRGPTQRTCGTGAPAAAPRRARPGGAAPPVRRDQAVAADLVARKGVLVDQQHLRAGRASASRRRCRPGRRRPPARRRSSASINSTGACRTTTAGCPGPNMRARCCCRTVTTRRSAGTTARSTLP